MIILSQKNTSYFCVNKKINKTFLALESQFTLLLCMIMATQSKLHRRRTQISVSICMSVRQSRVSCRKEMPINLKVGRCVCEVYTELDVYFRY